MAVKRGADGEPNALLVAVSVERVALIPRCAECESAWLPAGEERWRAYLGGDDLDGPVEVVLYCPNCAEREFGPD